MLRPQPGPTGGVPYFASALSGLAAYSASRARLVAMLKPCPGKFLTNCHRLRKPAASMKFASSISSIYCLAIANAKATGGQGPSPVSEPGSTHPAGCCACGPIGPGERFRAGSPMTCSHVLSSVRNDTYYRILLIITTSTYVLIISLQQPVPVASPCGAGDTGPAALGGCVYGTRAANAAGLFWLYMLEYEPASTSHQLWSDSSHCLPIVSPAPRGWLHPK
jgi:hypothetical protein